MKNRFSGDLGIAPLFFNRATTTYSKKIFQRDRAARRKRETPKVAQMAPALSDEDAPPEEILLAPEQDR